MYVFVHMSVCVICVGESECVCMYMYVWFSFSVCGRRKKRWISQSLPISHASFEPKRSHLKSAIT